MGNNGTGTRTSHLSQTNEITHGRYEKKPGIRKLVFALKRYFVIYFVSLVFCSVNIHRFRNPLHPMALAGISCVSFASVSRISARPHQQFICELKCNMNSDLRRQHVLYLIVSVSRIKILSLSIIHRLIDDVE